MRIALVLSTSLLGLVVGAGISLPLARGQVKATSTIGVDEIKEGMKGYGLTVFRGATPERFEIEVIGVLHNFRPSQDLILIKTPHPRLNITKNVRGMSGSPIYLDNRLAGAYAYSLSSFQAEPVAGVTPIAPMLTEMRRAIPPGFFPLEGTGGPLPRGKQPEERKPTPSAHRFDAPAGKYDLPEHAKQMASRIGNAGGSGVTRVATPLLMGGLPEKAAAYARSIFEPMGLEPLQAGGGGKQDPSAPTRFVDGGAVGISLIRGDLSATGLGTVTRVEGDKLVAFGHPMMNSGVTNLPTAIGRILWFLASDMRSFKIGMPVRDIGAMVNDRQSSIVVSHSVDAPVIPVKFKIKGAPGAPATDWNFEIAHEKFMTPAFMAVALGNAMQTTAAERQDVSWTVKAKLETKEHGVIQLEDQGVSIGGTPDEREFAESPLVKAAGAILNNPWEPAVLVRADVEIELHYEREIMRLRGADLLESEIDAGEPARVRLTLEPYSGKAITRVISIPIPRHLAGETVNITLEPGYGVEYERAAPENLGELVRNLENQSYPAKSVVASFSSGAGAVSYKGRIAKNLPPGALDSIQPVTTSVAPDTFGTQVRRVFTLGQFMTGQDSVSVKIRPVLR